MGSFTGASIEVGRRPRVEAPVTALQSFSLQRNLSICLVKTIQQLTLNSDIPSSFLHCIQFNFTILIRMCNTITTIIIDVCPISSVEEEDQVHHKRFINDKRKKTSNFEKCLMSKILLLLIYIVEFSMFKHDTTSAMSLFEKIY